MNAYITSRDLMNVIPLTYELHRLAGITKVIIIDCDSEYPDLLDWYKRLPDRTELIRETNLGPRAPWHSGVISERERSGRPYVVTDGDLDICRLDQMAVYRMWNKLKQDPELAKVGAAIAIDDLPSGPISRPIRSREQEYWEVSTQDNFYVAEIDTTFAVYREPEFTGYGPALRDGLNQVRHLPWYMEPETYTTDFKFYLNRLDHQRMLFYSPKMKAASFFSQKSQSLVDTLKGTE